MSIQAITYTQEQIVQYWKTNLDQQNNQAKEQYQKQIELKREKLTLCFRELEALQSKKSQPLTDIEVMERAIEQLKDQILGIQAKIEKIFNDNRLRLQNIEQHWNVEKRVQITNFAGNQLNLLLPFGADVELDFNSVVVTYLGIPFTPTILSDEQVKTCKTPVTEQHLISTGGELKVQ